MLRKILFVSFLSVLIGKSQNFSSGGRSAALCGASSTIIDVWSVQNNQGGLGQIRNMEAGVYYENRFQLKELSYSSAVFAFPLKKNGTVGITYNTFGYSAFRQSKAGLAYGMKLSDNFSAGLQLDYLTTGIQDPGNIYGKRSVFTGELGFIAKLTSQVTVSGHLFNVARVRLADYNNELIPLILKGGILYRVSDKVALMAETEKQSYADINVKAGIEYLPVKDVYLRAGASSFPRQMSFGAGILYKGLKFDLATTWHTVLGVSPQLSLSYVFSRQQTTSAVNP